MNQSEQQFLSDWQTLSRFGAVKGSLGVDRQAASKADGEQRRWLAQRLESEGFTVYRDTIGNQFGLLELVPGAPYVLTGSHLDSQPTGGRFDGAYGVLASAHACFRVAEMLREKPGQAQYNLAVVNWFNEEGARFKPSMMGSAVFTGQMALEEALTTSNPQGTTVREALDRLEERGRMEAPAIAGYAEIHVEQGRSMEEDGLSIGLVNATWGAHKFELKINGNQSHSGSARMADRQDALYAAALLITAARELVDQFPEGALHTACCELDVYPNSPVVVASEVNMHIDLRSPDADVIEQAHQSFQQTIRGVEDKAGVEIKTTAEHRWDQNPYPEAGVRLAREVAEDLDLSHGEVMTVAGHDSTNMKEQVPTIMLFVPSVQGISHNLDEYTHDRDLLRGLQHLTEVVRRMAFGALG